MPDFCRYCREPVAPADLAAHAVDCAYRAETPDEKHERRVEAVAAVLTARLGPFQPEATRALAEEVLAAAETGI